MSLAGELIASLYIGASSKVRTVAEAAAANADTFQALYAPSIRLDPQKYRMRQALHDGLAAVQNSRKISECEIYETSINRKLFLIESNSANQITLLRTESGNAKSYECDVVTSDGVIKLVGGPARIIYLEVLKRINALLKQSIFHIGEALLNEVEDWQSLNQALKTTPINSYSRIAKFCKSGEFDISEIINQERAAELQWRCSCNPIASFGSRDISFHYDRASVTFAHFPQIGLQITGQYRSYDGDFSSKYIIAQMNEEGVPLTLFNRLISDRTADSLLCDAMQGVSYSIEGERLDFEMDK